MVSCTHAMKSLFMEFEGIDKEHLKLLKVIFGAKELKESLAYFKGIGCPILKSE